MKKLVSVIDRSVNFVTEASTGYFESRFVSRPDKDYFIVYLSSQSGCAKACRMCHLTATRQVRSVDATIRDFREQAAAVLHHWDSLQLPHKKVHFNFMARGEPLASDLFISNASAVFGELSDLAASRGLDPKYLVSTIFPKNRSTLSLTHTFRMIQPEIYYSIYSVDPGFRTKWLPQALDPKIVIEKLADWQTVTSKRPKIHFAFIEGENDSPESVRAICDLVNEHRLGVNVNIVRYNPPNDSSKESNEATIQRNAELFRTLLPGSLVQVVPRVGFDVHASCGTFFSGQS